MPRFEYLEPLSIQEAIEILSRYGEEAKLISGGTDVLVDIRKKKLSPKYLVSLDRIPDLRGIWEDETMLHIGAATTHRTIEKSALIRKSYPVLADAVDNIGSIQIRNVATVGGNLCNAAPSADTAPPLLSLGAQVKLIGSSGERVLPLEQFFLGPGQTALSPTEIMTEILVPKPSTHSSGAYIKYARRKAMELALLGIAVTIRLSSDSTRCEEARIALGAAGPIPMRARAAEEYVSGRRFNQAVWTEAAKVVSEEAKPRTSMRATAEYRRQMIRVLLPEAARIAAERISAQTKDFFETDALAI